MTSRLGETSEARLLKLRKKPAAGSLLVMVVSGEMQPVLASAVPANPAQQADTRPLASDRLPALLIPSLPTKVQHADDDVAGPVLLPPLLLLLLLPVPP